VRRQTAHALLVALAVSVVVAGCGSSSLSALQLRAGARRACVTARVRLSKVPTPTEPTGGTAFLRQGIAGLAPELVALDRLHPTGELAVQYGRARVATEAEVHALQSSLKGLKAGNDPVVAIKTLQQQLVPLERTAAQAWEALGIPACTIT
jgi:hypothetical protein